MLAFFKDTLRNIQEDAPAIALGCVLAVLVSALFTVCSGKARAASGPSQFCVTKPYDGSGAMLLELDGDADERTFTFDLFDGFAGGYDLLVIFIDYTDANSSVTRFDMDCTVGLVKDDITGTPQVCDDISDGICTSTDSAQWQKATPGTAKWPWRLDVSGFPYAKCVFSAGTGTAGAGDDVKLSYRICTQ